MFAVVGNSDLWFAFALVATVLAGIDVIRTQAAGLTSWATTLLGVALMFAWWPEA